MIRKKDRIVIGAHECTFDHKSKFIYKTRSECTGFSIRKHPWKALLDKWPEIGKQLKTKIVTNYFYKLRIRIQAQKKKEIQRLSERFDVNEIFVLEETDQSRDMNFLNA